MPELPLDTERHDDFRPSSELSNDLHQLTRSVAVPCINQIYTSDSEFGAYAYINSWAMACSIISYSAFVADYASQAQCNDYISDEGDFLALSIIIPALASEQDNPTQLKIYEHVQDDFVNRVNMVTPLIQRVYETGGKTSPQSILMDFLSFSDFSKDDLGQPLNDSEKFGLFLLFLFQESLAVGMKIIQSAER